MQKLSKKILKNVKKTQKNAKNDKKNAKNGKKCTFLTKNGQKLSLKIKQFFYSKKRA